MEGRNDRLAEFSKVDGRSCQLLGINRIELSGRDETPELLLRGE